MLRTASVCLAVATVAAAALLVVGTLPSPTAAQGADQYAWTTGDIWVGFDDPRPHVHLSAYNHDAVPHTVDLRIRNAGTGDTLFEDQAIAEPRRSVGMAIDCGFHECQTAVVLEVVAGTDAVVPSGVVLRDPAAGDVTVRHLSPADFALFGPGGAAAHSAALGLSDELAALRADVGALTAFLRGVEGPPSAVFLARSDIPVDALGAGAQAAPLGAPVLVTPPHVLDRDTAAALADLSPRLVVVAGGPAAISQGVLDEVAALLPGAEIRRVAGPTRTATAAALARLPAELPYGRPVLRPR
jgi:hypothetical protein